VRALLDSSVLVAACISRAGICADLLEDLLSDHKCVISNFILDELARKLKERFRFPDEEIAEIRGFVSAAAERVEPVHVETGRCRDPNDLPVIGTAVAGRVAVLITVDKDLLDLETWEGIAIIPPAVFWRVLDSTITPA
jgi:uncharacterized protein